MRTSLNRWIGKIPDVSAVLSRFPVPVALMAVFTIILIVVDSWSDRDRLGWLTAGLILAAYMAVNITLARETREKPSGLVMQLVLSGVILLLSWFAKDIRFVVPMAVGGSILLLGNMVRWRKSRDDVHVWDFTHKIWTGAIFAIVGSMIYTAGIFAISAALKSLFGLNINAFVTDFLLPIGLGFLAPLYWLSTIPPVDEDFSELYDNPGFVSKAVAFLGTWILSPLTLIYALILVAYGLKIILQSELPKGEIAGLTTPFLIIGTLTWLVLDPPFTKDKVLAKIFRKFWFFLSLPAALLLAVAIGVRIGEYGFTWERLALVFIVIWSLCLGVWFAFGPKDKRDIRLIPGLAAALLCVGAFAIEPMSFFNQKSRVISGLKAAGVMTHAGVIKPKSEIDITNEAAAQKAKGALLYLERNDGWPTIERLFEGAETPAKEDGKGDADLYKRLALNDIQLNLSRDENVYVSYYSDMEPIDVRGFETLSGPYWINRNNAARNDAQKKGGFKLEIQGDDLVISNQDTEITRYDVVTWAKSFDVIDQQVRIPNPVIAVHDTNDQKLSLVVRSLNFPTGVSEGFSIEVMLLSAGY